MSTSNPSLSTVLPLGAGAFLNAADAARLSCTCKELKETVDQTDPQLLADRVSIDLCFSRQSPPKTLLEKLVTQFDKKRPFMKQGHYSDELLAKVREAAMSYLRSAPDFLPEGWRTHELSYLTLSQMNTIYMGIPGEKNKILIDFFQKFRAADPSLSTFEKASEIRNWMRENPAELDDFEIPQDRDLAKVTFPPEALLLRCLSRNLTSGQFEQMLEVYDKEKGCVKKGVQEFVLAALASNHTPRLEREAFLKLFKQSAEHGLSECLEMLIHHEHFREPTYPFYLGESLKESAKNGHVNCLEKLVHCERFHELQRLQLALPFCAAAANGHKECLEMLITCNRFHEIKPKALSAAFSNAAEAGSKECLETLIQCERFHEIELHNLGFALQIAAANGHKECLEMLITCNRFHEIEPKALGAAFSYAAKAGSKECLEMLIQCERFHEIEPKALGAAFSNAAKAGSKECLETLIQCERFHEIELHNLGSALKATAANGYKECLEMLIQCERFHVELADLGFALQMAAANGRKECLEILFQCERFHEIEPQTLSNELLSAAISDNKEYLKILTTCGLFHKISPESLDHAINLADCFKHKECKQLLKKSVTNDQRSEP